MKVLLLVTLLILSISLFCINHMDIMTTMTGEFPGADFGASVASLDYNGDGYQDLVVCERGWNPTGNQPQGSFLGYGKLFFYMGGPNFDNVPEFTIEGTYPWQYVSNYIFNAGDLNGDGREDLAAGAPESMGPDGSYSTKLFIFYGKDTYSTEPDTILYFVTNGAGLNITPLGDINHDGYAELGYTIQPDWV